MGTTSGGWRDNLRDTSRPNLAAGRVGPHQPEDNVAQSTLELSPTWQECSIVRGYAEYRGSARASASSLEVHRHALRGLRFGNHLR